MTVRHEVATGSHLFIGGPMNGVIRKVVQKEEGEMKYLIVPVRTTTGFHEYTYENMGYALLHREGKL